MKIRPKTFTGWLRCLFGLHDRLGSSSVREETVWTDRGSHGRYTDYVWCSRCWETVSVTKAER